MKRLFILLFAIFYTVLSAQDSLKLKLYRENVGSVFTIYADNEEFAPISLEYTYTAENMTSSQPNKSVLVIPAKTSKFIITELRSADPKKGTKFNYNAYYVLGDVNTKSAESNYIYNLPFEKNKVYRIYQGYNGSFSHQGTFSLDFSLAQGDKVFAAREGKVIQVITKNKISCATKDCAKYNNKIVILHADGTFAEYVHLKQNGAVVKPGDEVEKGQLIGYSGNTGWSQGPHLHFSVYVNTIDGKRNYVKTKFRISGSETPVYLDAKKSYSRNE